MLHQLINNVFLYKSYNNEYFYRLFIPAFLQFIFTSAIVWIIFLFIFAFVFRKKNSFESLLLYTCILVAISPSIANQYLAIVVPFVSVFLNPFTLSYTLFGTVYLMLDYDGLHLLADQNVTYGYRFVFYPLLVVLLCLGLIRSVWSRQLAEFIKKIYIEIKIKFGYFQ